jgi:hypothetical protein
MVAALWAFAALGAACSPGNRPVLSEVLYDPDGADTGYEFVELVNHLPVDVALDQLRLETGDGAGADRWSLRWTGATGDTIRAGDRFVIGGVNVVPAPHAVATLSIQNGPDAIRLVWPDGVIEILGYGELEFAEYFCDSPAPDAGSGFSLARIPDDAALGANALDFRPALPTPGRANQPGTDVAIEPGSLALTPARPEAGTMAELRLGVRNAGRGEIAADSIVLVVHADGADASVVPLGALGEGESIEARAPVGPLPAGKFVIRARVVLAGDESPGNDADSLILRVGTGPLAVREIQFHPESGEGEWVELENVSGAALDPSAFRIGDRSGTLGAPQGGTETVAADSLVVFAQRRADLLARFPALDPARVWEAAPWPALNNSDDAAGIADEVRAAEPDGTWSDIVAYSAAGIPAGVPLERRGGAWWPSLAGAGTPLGPPVMPSPIAGSFALAPRRIAHAGMETRIVWDLPWPAGLATLEIYDLAGRRVARPFVDLAVPARGERGLRVPSLAAGVYVAAFQVRPVGSGEPLVATQPLRVDGTAP